jgi:hypothetical protein
MALRLQNLSKYHLVVDFRGGALSLKPGEISRPLREEALYWSPYLPYWERKRWIRKIKVSMSELHSHEGRVPSKHEEPKTPGHPEETPAQPKTGTEPPAANESGSANATGESPVRSVTNKS